MSLGRSINVETNSRYIEVIRNDVIDVVNFTPSVIEVVSSGTVVINTSGSSSQEFEQLAPSASWVIPHTLARIPSVTIYLLNGELVYPDVLATSTSVNVIFAVATSGRAVLT